MTKIIEDEKDTLVIEFDSDRSVAELIKERLLNTQGVSFASVEKDHPEVGKIRLVVKADKNPKAYVSKVIDGLIDEVEEIKGQLPKGEK